MVKTAVNKVFEMTTWGLFNHTIKLNKKENTRELDFKIV